MKKVLITGSNGFLGRNLWAALTERKDIELIGFDVNDPPMVLSERVESADFIFHLAGVNRPKNSEEFQKGNADLTCEIMNLLKSSMKAIPVVLSSSTQAEFDNPYGKSKRIAEKLVAEYGKATRAPTFVYRLTNVFGKWSLPNYNSVVATFCHNVARNLEIEISDRSREVELVYVDDVIAEFLSLLDGNIQYQHEEKIRFVAPTFKINLGKLADTILAFREIRKTLTLPDLSDPLTKYLYTTYLSYLDRKNFAYGVELKSDKRGNLAELIKSKHAGQLFVSRSYPGVKRGNHYHHSKVEKFCVIQGTAAISFRHIFENESFTYEVSGDDLSVVDIPPGYTHSIENTSDQELLVLFWANEIFDPRKPDTFACEV